MNIAVFLGAADGNDPIYADTARAIGKWIANNGHTLVYGGSKRGMMGKMADACLENGGKVIGIVVDYQLLQGRRHQGLTEYIHTQTLTERRLELIDRADAYIALPGGPGTLDEITEITSLDRLNENDKPCILYNVDGFYQPLKDMFQKMMDEGFAEEEYFSHLRYADNFEDLVHLLEDYK